MEKKKLITQKYIFLIQNKLIKPHNIINYIEILKNLNEDHTKLIGHIPAPFRQKPSLSWVI